MFKFVSKGDNDCNESALFYNGQRMFTIYTTVNPFDEVVIVVEDGSGRQMKEWEDFIEDTD